MFFLRLRSSMAVRSYRNGNDCGISVLRKCNTSFTFSNGNQRVSISSFVGCSVKLTSLNFNFSCSVRPLAFSTRCPEFDVALDCIRRGECCHLLPPFDFRFFHGYLLRPDDALFPDYPAQRP